MAEVYRALDLADRTRTSRSRSCAARTLTATRAPIARFAREAEVQARLRHRNVAALLATGVTERGEPYLVVELLRGKTLRGVIKAEGAVAPVRAASYAWQALQGLARGARRRRAAPRSQAGEHHARAVARPGRARRADRLRVRDVRGQRRS